MFKKSHALSTAGIFLAVLFVLAGCQNPEAPVVNQGDTSVQFPEFPEQAGPGEIIVNNNTGGGTEAKLPAGLTYPGGAKVMTGSADDIILAFNGSILVADTSDATGGSVVPMPPAGGTTNGGSNLSGGDAYIQEGVDQILWTGTGGGSAGPLGTIIVPPGKTLFIGGDLVIDGDATAGAFSFGGIRVLDKGGYAPPAGGEEPSLSILAATGAAVGSDKPAGKIVFLAGSKTTVVTSTTTAGTFTLGGDLEIHRGATVDLTAPTGGGATTLLVATEGSAIDVYGNLTLGADTAAAPNVINGKLTIQAGAAVSAAADAGGLAFGDDVVLNGGLTLPTSGNVDFNGNLTVGENTGLTLISTGTIKTTFNKKATFKGYLNLGGATTANYAVGPSGHLAIEAGGLIGNGVWAGTDAALAAAFGSKEPGADNDRVTIADPGSGAGYSLYLPLTVTAFDQLKALAEHPSLHLQSLTYGGGDLPANAELTVAKGNYVVWTGTALPAKVTVQSGGAINLAAGVTSAGDITLIGGGRELKRVSSVAVTGGGSTTYPFTLTAQPVLNENNASTFNNRLATLTIGDGKEKTDVTIGDVASFAPVTGEIIVKQNASLTVGGSSTTTIDIPGTITLEKGDAADTGGKFATASTLGSLSGASFGSTVKIDIGEHASFDTSSLVNQATFAKLRNLTVNGTLTVTSTGATGTDSATLFDALEKTKGSAGDVGGSGSANFPGWVVGTAKEHAFDQILGITNVRIKSTDILKNTSGFDSDHTSDGGTATGTPTLTVDAITILGEGLTVDRNLNVTSDGTITFPSTTASLTISKGISISANGGLVLSAPSGGDAVLVANGGNTVITAPATGTGVFNTGTAGGLTLKSGTLNIPGQLIITEGSLLAGGADAAAGQLSLAAPSSGNDTYVKNVTIAPATGSAVTLTINEEGELSNGAASSVGKGSSIAAGAADVQIIGAASSALSFIGAAVGEGTLKASAGGAAIKATEVTDTSAAPPTTGEAQITGEWEAVDGAAVLTGGTASGNEILTISGNVTVAVGGSAYDTAKLGGGSTLAKEVVFNADAGKITLGTDSTLTGGNLTTTGKGVFEFATGGNTLKTGGGSLTIGSAVLVAGGIQQGTLNLTTGVLAIGSSGFKVGDDTKFTTNLTAAPASPAEIVLSVNGGTIQNGGAITLLAITDAAAAKSRKGKLSIGSTYALETYDTTDSTKTLKIALTTGTAKEGGGSGAGAVTVETTANDLYGDFSGKATSDSNPTPALTATLGSKVELDGKNIKINSGTGNSITSTSLVYTNLVPKP